MNLSRQSLQTILSRPYLVRSVASPQQYKQFCLSPSPFIHVIEYLSFVLSRGRYLPHSSIDGLVSTTEASCCILVPRAWHVVTPTTTTTLCDDGDNSVSNDTTTTPTTTPTTTFSFTTDTPTITTYAIVARFQFKSRGCSLREGCNDTGQGIFALTWRIRN